MQHTVCVEKHSLPCVQFSCCRKWRKLATSALQGLYDCVCAVAHVYVNVNAFVCCHNNKVNQDLHTHHVPSSSCRRGRHNVEHSVCDWGVGLWVGCLEAVFWLLESIGCSSLFVFKILYMIDHVLVLCFVHMSRSDVSLLLILTYNNLSRLLTLCPQHSVVVRVVI